MKQNNKANKINKKDLDKSNDSTQKNTPFSPTTAYNDTTHPNKLSEDDIKHEINKFKKDKDKNLLDMKIKNELDEKDIQKKLDNLDDNDSEEYNKLKELLKDKQDNNRKKESSMKRYIKIIIFYLIILIEKLMKK